MVGQRKSVVNTDALEPNFTICPLATVFSILVGYLFCWSCSSIGVLRYAYISIGRQLARRAVASVWLLMAAT